MDQQASRHEPVYVTRAIVPDPLEYSAYIGKILESRYLTNAGQCVVQLEERLRAFMDISQLSLCTNGTLALQLALRASGMARGEVITTPFSYVATVSALLWEGYTPVFADIDEETCCLDPRALEGSLSDNTVGILPVHIYGNACDVEAIGHFAAAHGLTTIYDAAQAFGSMYKGKSLCAYGDFATLSFHATKVFHTVEGGAVVSHSAENKRNIDLLRSFGHIGDVHHTLGINAKMTEPHAAMGLCLLGRFAENIQKRKRVSEMYDALLPTSGLRKPKELQGFQRNYSYYPIIFDSHAAMTKAIAALNTDKVFPRRYFYPSLNNLPYLKKTRPCPIAEDISSRVLCVPLYAELEEKTVERILGIVKSCL